jgi:hypothetical protein
MIRLETQDIGFQGVSAATPPEKLKPNTVY